jgi:hypothetical protein
MEKLQSFNLVYLTTRPLLGNNHDGEIAFNLRWPVSVDISNKSDFGDFGDIADTAGRSLSVANTSRLFISCALIRCAWISRHKKMPETGASRGKNEK